MPLAEIKGAAYNPRKKLKPGDPDYELLSKGLSEFGCVEPLVWNKRTGTLVGGHQRLQVLMDLGQKEIEVSVVDLPPDREAALNIALNKISGDWDFPKLRDVLAELDTGAIDTDLTGFTDEEIRALFDRADVVEDFFDANEAADAIKNPVTALGDTWVLGPHVLVCGDSTSPKVLSSLLGGKKARSVFTDPPYNVNYGASIRASSKNAGNTILNDNFKTHQDFYQFLHDAIQAFRPHVTGDVYMCMSSSEISTLQQAFVACGGHWSTFIIWVKSSFTLGRANYQRQYEPILYGWFEGSSHYWSGARNLGDVYKDELKVDEWGAKWVKLDAGVESDIWEFPRNQKNPDHPTQKPIGLCARAIKNSSLKRDIILDPFVGGGSTMIACEQLDRACYMVELDPRFCDVVVQRYEQFTGKKAVKHGA